MRKGNPRCRVCGTGLRKKGSFKVGEDRYFCPTEDKHEEILEKRR